MLKLIAPAFALALLSPAVGQAQPAAAPPTTAAAQVKVSDADALDDDILAVIDLPFAAAEARSAGVEETELKQALEVSRDVGFSAGEAGEFVAEEATAATGKRGPKKGFGQYVRVQLAAGLRGKQLAAKIRARKDEVKALSASESDAIKTKLDGVRVQHSAFRLRALERRKELIAGGKKAVFVAQERHQARLARIAAAEGRTAAAGDAIDARLRALDEKIAATAGPEKDALELERRRLLMESGKLQTRETKLETRETKLETRETKLEAKHDGKPEKPGPKHEGKAPSTLSAPPQ